MTHWQNRRIHRARLIDRPGLYDLTCDDRGLVAEIDPHDPKIFGVGDRADTLLNADAIDLHGDWLSPGGVDLQINGALGLAFPDLTLADLPQVDRICQLLWRQGVQAFLPTIVTTAIEKVHQSLATLAAYQDYRTQYPAGDRAEIWGAHLEGPFLNPQKRGAHPQQFLLPLTVNQVAAVVGSHAAQVAKMTLASELDPTGEAIDWLRSRGITVSLGHSQATAAEAMAAFDRGATMVTHAFNAMPPLHHREPGLLGAAIVRSGVRCGFIADGVHVCPTMLQVLLRASEGPRGLFMVSDALAPLGLPDGIYPWDERTIEVKNGTARLSDGTLSGTTLSLLEGVLNLIRWQLCTPEQAIALATIAPRRALGRLPESADPYGGESPAQLLRWHRQPDGQWTWRRLQGP
ncbi:N-acetylglucosamine-6-phosphate deacetylase [Limnothrix sp. PR1529]|uniref:N-acetylglucosamine-6-phosphate deacetylase n=1 Tax=Limnothrix sp. PR1529 TaxID=1704291 RepID=UPI00081ED9F6|nr:N-acetylglucosamine-6-phosphate deacetylase [Limnothrix sp. PR1529]OCQ95105.1 N-acetylglucosamine-6-phosphate deacetylase [Limnothrix sp. P13C2]PIB13988.1 N-acetylglucosamine-6-phosphate deacetylase [Limnothrix sp. PR1529]